MRGVCLDWAAGGSAGFVCVLLFLSLLCMCVRVICGVCMCVCVQYVLVRAVFGFVWEEVE